MRGRLNFGAGFAEWGELDRVVVGDRLVPRQIDVHFLGGSESPQPALDFVIEMQDGVPVCTKISMHQRDQGRGVLQQDLRDIRLLDWMEEIISAVSMEVVPAEREGEIAAVMGSGEDYYRRARSATRAMQRGGRRKIDRKHLQRVAEVYQEHQDDGGVDAVALAFGTSYRSAARWVQKAREEGVL